MSKRLKDNVSSRYIEAANKMTSKNARRKIVAYVESYDDVFFWRSILSSFETSKLYFEVMLPTKKNKLERGKKAVISNLPGDERNGNARIMNMMKNKVGNDMIACVDADYDYLLQGITPVSKELLENKFIFHTYAYAIENLQCYAQGLHDVTVAATLNDHSVIDYVDYLTQYSEAIFPLFVWNIMFYRSTHYANFTISDFNKIIETGSFNMQRPYEGIQRVRKKVGRKIEQLQREYPDAKDNYLKTKAELKELGVTAQTTYLYIQGHHLFDGIVVPMLSKVCDYLIREREREIYHQAKHNTQLRNELSCYTHSLVDIGQMLKKSQSYAFAAPVQKIRADIEAFLNETSKQTDTKNTKDD